MRLFRDDSDLKVSLGTQPAQRGGCLEPVRAAEMNQARDLPVDSDHERIGRIRLGRSGLTASADFEFE